MQKIPRISVIMPVYNREHYVAEAIESIIYQTFKDFEFIIIDDGSTDCSLEIIEGYSEKDLRIKVIRNQHNIGIPRTRNKGIDLAQGEYVAFMDSDDISLPERFAKQIDFMEKNPEIFVLGTQCEFIDSKGNYIRTKNLPLLPIEVRWFLYGKSIINSSVMARSELFKLLGYKHKNIKSASDYEIWTRISEKFLIANLPDVLLRFRRHDSRISKTARDNQKSNSYQIIRERLHKLTGVELTTEQIEGFRYTNRIKDVYDAIILSKTVVQMHKKAKFWSDDAEDRKLIHQLTSKKLRTIWAVQRQNFRLMPYVLYSIVIDPQSFIKISSRRFKKIGSKIFSISE